MITYIFGKTGSGKSYKAVTLILEQLKERPVFGNIKFVKFLAGYTYLDETKMRDWLESIENIYTVAQDELTSEEEIYKQLRDKGISDCAIFIDEAHIYGFNNTKKKDFLMFFLALQRHVNLNIYLITQTRKQLNTVFHDLGDTVISAISPTERFSKSIMEYNYYSHVDMVKNPENAYKKEKLIPKKEIFELYSSGAVNHGDDGFRKKVRFLIAGVLIAISFSAYQLYSLFSKDSKTVKTVEPDSSKIVNNGSYSGLLVSDNNSSSSKKLSSIYYKNDDQDSDIIYCSLQYCTVDEYLISFNDFISYVSLKQKISYRKMLDVYVFDINRKIIISYLKDRHYSNPVLTWFKEDS